MQACGHIGMERVHEQCPGGSSREGRSVATHTSPPMPRPPTRTHGPVVVEVTEFIGKSLHVIWLQTSGIVDHIEVSRGNCSLTHTLAHNEIVIPMC